MIKELLIGLSQKLVNRQYKKNGLTDEILDAQLRINKLRHETDTTDKSKRIYDRFVQ